MVKERPILFSGSMVRALLDGRKTQTRRVVKPQPAPNVPHDGGTRWVFDPTKGLHVPCGTVGHLTVGEKTGLRCPYGKPGDRLWVRETWAYNGQASRNFGPENKRREGYVTYAADGAKITHFFQEGPPLPAPPQVLPDRREGEDDLDCKMRRNSYMERYFRRFRTSIHMPRWASRLALEVTEVRVQRVQEISEADAQAEGLEQARDDPERWLPGRCAYPSWAFRILWDSINGKRPGCSWVQNPWVWAVSFKALP